MHYYSYLYNLNHDLSSVFSKFYGAKASIQKDERGNSTLSIPLAGYKKSEVSVRVEPLPEGDFLVVKAENAKRGKFYQHFAISDVDITKISASLQDGILEVTLPPLEQPKPTIEIKVT